MKRKVKKGSARTRKRTARPRDRWRPPYRPVTAADVTDHALLPKRFDMFEAYVHGEFKTLGEKIMPLLQQLTESVGGAHKRLSDLEHGHRQHGDRIAALESATKPAAKPAG